MRALYPSHFAKLTLFFRARTNARRLSVRVIVCVSLKAYFLVVLSIETTIRQAENCVSQVWTCKPLCKIFLGWSSKKTKDQGLYILHPESSRDGIKWKSFHNNCMKGCRRILVIRRWWWRGEWKKHVFDDKTNCWIWWRLLVLWVRRWRWCGWTTLLLHVHQRSTWSKHRSAGKIHYYW